MDRKTTFVVALIYLVVLLTLALLFFVKRSFLVFLPESFGPIPVGVPWFGALGAVLISLTGIFEHEHDWDSGYWPWHVARPLIGIGLGVVSVIILQAGILAVGSTPATQPKAIPANLLYYLIAFLVGYREETFRELIKRLVDVILSPGNGATAAPTLTALAPPNAPHNAPTQVVITGSGFTNTQSVTFGSAAVQFTVNSDSQLTTTTPTVAVPGDIPLTVKSKAGTATRQFTFN
jgi:hypothetical protein